MGVTLADPSLLDPGSGSERDRARQPHEKAPRIGRRRARSPVAKPHTAQTGDWRSLWPFPSRIIILSLLGCGTSLHNSHPKVSSARSTLSGRHRLDELSYNSQLNSGSFNIPSSNLARHLSLSMDFTQLKWLDSRAQNQTGRTKSLGMAGLNRDFWKSGLTNGTKEIVEGLVLNNVQQTRYMHMAFGSVSIVFAVWIIFRIWYDSWRASKLSAPLRRKKFDFLWKLHPAESFPLLLGFFILVQQLSFVSIQGKALDTIFVRDCRGTSQIVFTQIFIIGYIHFVFGLEMAIRSLRRNRFAPRPKYTTVVCLAVALIMFILTWLSTRLRLPRNKCFGDMIWRSIRSAPLGVVICSFLIPSFILMAAIIALQLHRTVNMDPNERIAGSRMVYYLLLTALLYTLVLPFWVQAVLSSFDQDLSSSRVAEFVLFISGAIIAFTHMFLRANAARTAIKPSATPWAERRGFRLFGPSDLELMHISSPIMKEEYHPDEKVSDMWILQHGNTKEFLTTASGGANFIPPRLPSKATIRISQWPLAIEPPPPPKDQPKESLTAYRPAIDCEKLLKHQRQASYSLFPGSENLQLPASVYTAGAPTSKATINALAPTFINPFAGTSPTGPENGALQPPPAPWKPGHRRGSSAESMATVQIGIRFSTAPADLAASGITCGSSSQAPKPNVRGVIDSVSSGWTALSPKTLGPKSGRLAGPLVSTTTARTASHSHESEYAWLNIASPALAMDTPLRTLPRATAESNRSEIANLERSGSLGARAPPIWDKTRKDTGFF